MIGLSYYKRGDRARGKEAWERALALAPNDPNILRVVGGNMPYGMGTERAAEGVELVKRARQLNPLMPTWTTMHVGYASYFAGQYEQALEALEQSGAPGLELKAFKALTYAQLGRKTDAARRSRRSSRKSRTSRPGAGSPTTLWSPAAARRRSFLDGARKAGLPIDQPAPSN